MMEVFCLHHLFLQPPSVGNSGKQEIMTRGFLRSLYLKVFVYREFYLYLGWIFTWWLGNFVCISWASHYGLENSEIYSLKCSTWWFNSSWCLVVLISKFKFDFDVCSGHQAKTHMSTLPICLLLHAWSTLTGLLFYVFIYIFFWLQMAVVIYIFTPSSFIQMPLHINGPLEVCTDLTCSNLTLPHPIHPSITHFNSIFHVATFSISNAVCNLMFAAIAELLDNAVDEVIFCANCY